MSTCALCWLSAFVFTGCFQTEPARDGVVFTWRWSGAGPQEVEREIVRPAEVALMGLEGVVSVESLSGEGVAVVTVWFEGPPRSLMGRATDLYTLVRARVEVPEGVEGPWLAEAGDEARVVARVAVAGDGAWEACAEVLADAARRVPGVGEARVSGAGFRRLGVHVDPTRLAAYGIDVGAVRDAVVPPVVLRPGVVLPHEPAPLRRIEDLLRLPLGPAGAVLLRDIASVGVELEPAAPRVWLDGAPAALVTVLLRPDATAELGPALHEVLGAAASGCAHGVEVREIGAEQTVLELAVPSEGGMEALLEVTSRASSTGLLEFGRHLPGALGLVDSGRARWTSPVLLASALATLVSHPVIDVRGWQGAGSHTTLWLTGPDHGTLTQVAAVLGERFAEVGCAADDGLGPERPEIGVQLDRDRLADLGIPFTAVTEAVQAATGGLSLGSVAAGGETLPVVLLVGEGGFRDALPTLTLPGPSPVPLANVAALTLERAPSALRRRDGRPATRLELSCPAGQPDDARMVVVQVLAAQPLPPGVAAEVGVVPPRGIEGLIRRLVARR